MTLLTPPPAQIQAKLDLAIALALFTWPPLTLAIQNAWGGPLAAEKREWLAGAVSELLTGTPDVDGEYLEEFLLQVMNDEFETNLEDGSAEEVAEKIIALRRQIHEGDFTMVDQMQQRWEVAKLSKSQDAALSFMERQGEDQETDDESILDEDEDEDEDVSMDGVSSPARFKREKLEPEIDEDGFTKVATRRR